MALVLPYCTKMYKMLEKPKGTLIAFGCNECGKDAEILKGLLQETGKFIPKICVLTIAADKPEQTEYEYRTMLEGLGAHDISIINFNVYTEADTDENLEKVKQANIIIFCDGSQLKLSSLLNGTHLIGRIRKR